MLPLPAVEWICTWPPSSLMLRLTTSMPTPRPETSLTASAVEKPGAKIEVEDALLGQLLVRADQAALARLGEDPVALEAAAVVADFDDDVAALVIGAAAR